MNAILNVLLLLRVNFGNKYWQIPCFFSKLIHFYKVYQVGKETKYL